MYKYHIYLDELLPHQSRCILHFLFQQIIVLIATHSHILFHSSIVSIVVSFVVGASHAFSQSFPTIEIPDGIILFVCRCQTDVAVQLRILAKQNR